MHVEILLPEGKVKYLGLLITFVDQESTEIQQRIRCAWSAFTKRTDIPIISTTITDGGGTWPQQANTNKYSAHSTQNASTHCTTRKKFQNKKKNKKETGGKDTLDDEISEKKSAQMMIATKTTVFHSTTMRKSQ